MGRKEGGTEGGGVDGGGGGWCFDRMGALLTRVRGLYRDRKWLEVIGLWKRQSVCIIKSEFRVFFPSFFKSEVI